MPTFFDIHSEDYDRNFSYTAIGILQREKVHRILHRQLPEKKSLKILEINCGTGIDALWLAGKGHTVTATDQSEDMIRICQEKISDNHNENAPRFVRCSFSQLSQTFVNQTFDVIFSNFGGLNCIPPPDLEALSFDLKSLLKPGGKFIAVVMGRKCLWEKLYFLFKRDRQNVRRRSGNNASATLKGTVQPTWYYSPIEFKKRFEDFSIARIQSVGLFIPPSYLNPFFTKKPVLLKLLQKLENISGYGLFADYADHYLICLERK
jgi:ubiquinone/menaquinone biosynthesis C-methylase UbiE